MMKQTFFKKETQKINFLILQKNLKSLERKNKKGTRAPNKLFSFKFLPYSKRSMELAIPFLVLMTLVLTISALVVFNLNSNSVGAKIGDYRLLDDIHIKEKQVDFYVSDIVENTISGIQKGKDVKTQFIENFNKELNRYKNGDTFYVRELGQLQSQLSADKIKIEDKKISIVFKIEMGKEFPDKMTVIYSHEKEFYGFLS